MYTVYHPGLPDTKFAKNGVNLLFILSLNESIFYKSIHYQT